MSFIPAEEDSDEDFGEFFDDDIYLKNAPQKYTTRFTNNTNQNQNEKEAMKNTVQPDKASVPWKSVSLSRATSIFTQEDYKKAVITGNISVIEQCLNQADLTFDTPFKGGWTALMYAANHAQPSVLQILIAHGANVNYHYDFFTPLMAASSASDIEKEENVTQCVKLLLAKGVSVNAQDRQHTTSLMLASKEGHVEAVKVLIEHGADVNKQDGRGWTALTWGAQRARKDVVEQLLNSGADPKIKHRDQLTVIDLAATLPTNEILELLEHKSVQHEQKTTSNGPLDLSKPQPKCDDLKIFLIGLDLSHLVDLFQQQLIDLSLLMTLTEQDLIQLGVEQLGARKKILNAINAVHKKDWQSSSLVSFHYNKKLSCADVIAVMANTSKHLSYICSTMRYIMGQLKKHPDIITQPTDKVSPVLLSRHIEDTHKNMKALNDQLLKLQIELNKEMKLRCSEPADLLQLKCFEQKKRKQLTRVTFILTLCACLALPLYYHRNTLFTHLPASAFSIFSTNV